MKLVALVSGGIDSPVALHMMLEKGYEIIGLHMDNRPFADDSQIEKVKALVKRLEELHDAEIPLYTVPHGAVSQEMIAKKGTYRYRCILCRRMMFRTGEAFAGNVGAEALLTGESLGQVASQTLKNIYAESEAVDMPIIRPLIGFDKEEIVRISKDIGTYEISIIPSKGCELAPKRPSIGARLKDILKDEEKIPVDALLSASLEGLKRIK